MINPSLKKELVTFPLFTGIVFSLVDFAMSVWLINFTDLCLCEASPLNRDEHGNVDIERAKVVLPAKIIAYIAASFVLYRIVRKPTENRYTSPKQIGEAYKPFMLWFVVLYASVSPPVFIVLFWNPLVALTAVLGVDFVVPSLLVLAMSGLFAVMVSMCAYYFLSWRYLTDEAKEKYFFLAWPYTKGWMKEENLA